MELKTARLTLLIDPNKKSAFEGLCAQQDLTPSQVVRQLIRDYLAQHGVQYVGSGLSTGDAQPADEPASRRTEAIPDRVASPPAKRPAGHRRG
ncbi:MAG: CopG family transcriptional regulator [Rhodoferax sp.]